MSNTRTVGVRELKAQISRILRDVIDQGEAVEVTHRGRPIARIIPLAAPTPEGRNDDAIWTDIDRLAAEIGTRWPVGSTAVDAVREGRRDL
jgi:prevent-host-death family protein